MRTKAIQYKLILIFLFAISAIFSTNEEFIYSLLNEEESLELKIINRFPTESQMIKDKFFVRHASSFDFYNDTIIFCDQIGNQVLQFTLDGKYMKKIGTMGQGPGEYNFPCWVFVQDDKLYISDNGNRRLLVFSASGEFIEYLKIPDEIMGLAVYDDKIFIHALSKAEAEYYGRMNASIAKIYNTKGELIKKIPGLLESKYNHFYMNSTLDIDSHDNFIYCLQRYGTFFRIYNFDGEELKEVELEVNPMDLEVYRRTGYLYAFNSFCMDGENILAVHAAQGKIPIYVFDLNGELIKKYQIKQNKNEIYAVVHMKVLAKDDKKLLYVLLLDPDIEFQVVELY